MALALPDGAPAVQRASDSAAEGCADRLVEVALLSIRLMRPHILGTVPDLTMAQFRTLMRVHQQPECTPSDVAERLGIARPTASRLVDGLVRRGLVTRRDGDGDRRRVVLELTRDGIRRVAASRRAVRRQMVEALSDLPAPALAEVCESLGRLAAALGPKARGPQSHPRDSVPGPREVR
jgi:DNA-binding MarR family transcriptional regulator